jgi:D-arabinose 1-dehydrogenase-like Zn-dependent alcohol dehydrogenase
MKAALLTEIGKPLTIHEVPKPTIGPDEVLVKTRTCGICRTDLHIQDGLAYVPALPHIPGHEPAGVVAQIGPAVTSLRIGQRVVPHLFVARQPCLFCRTGRHAQAIHLDGIIGVTMPGGFSEYFKAPARNLLPLPDNVAFDVGGLTSCAVITAVHAYRRAGLQANDTAVVVGAGGIGQIMLQILCAAGVRVIAVSRSRENLDMAVQNGAALAVQLGSSDAADQVRAFAGADCDGASCVFDMVGTAETMKAAAEFAMRCGRIIVVGEEPQFPAIDTIQIAQRELQIIGSRNGGLQDAIDALQMMSAGIIRPPVADRFPLERINDAMELLRSNKVHGRIIINIST